MSNSPRAESVDRRSVATLRSLAIDQVQAAGSGHLGLPLGAAPILHTLFSRFLVSDPREPNWLNRDRFVLSAGHGSALLYATLHLAGYGVSLDDLRAFRQWGSITPGHPEHGKTPGVDATTGPLGQGLGNAIGMAIAESMASARLPREAAGVVDHRTFALVSDGDLMEGVALEAAALAGVLGLGKLVVFYDDNDVVIDGRASATHSADGTCAAFAAWGWDVSEPIDGEDVEAIAAATRRAIDNDTQPSLVRVRTVIGYGSIFAGTPKIHGGAVADEEATRMKRSFGEDLGEPFAVPADVRASWLGFAERGSAARAKWEANVAAIRASHPHALDGFDAWRRADRLTEDDVRALVVPLPDPEPGRFAGGRVLNALASVRPEIVGGSADLAVATTAYLQAGGDYSATNRSGRNIRFGVREHAMGTITNGIALHGLLRPFANTYLAFASYQANALRMAAMQQLPVLHVFTHDSITVGEDGPTHQPIEMLSMLRATPGMLVLRPADADEVISCFTAAFNRQDGPTALILARMALPPLDRSASFGDASRGGYLLRPAAHGAEPDVVIVASGSEVALAVDAAELLADRGVAAAVVSMPCQQVFLEQDEAYRERVLPTGVPRLVVEAGHPLSLWQLAGGNGAVHGISRFGASAPPDVMLANYGFTAAQVADEAASLARETPSPRRAGTHA